MAARKRTLKTGRRAKAPAARKKARKTTPTTKPKPPAKPAPGPSTHRAAPPSGGGTGTVPVGPPPERPLGGPVFAQPQPTPDPTMFRTQHPSDNPVYNQIAAYNKAHGVHALPFPAPRGGVEPVLTLEQVLGVGAASTAMQRIDAAGQIVFHSTGDCGSTRNPVAENRVVDKMISDFHGEDAPDVPHFNLLLGDIVYSFGEAQYYYDQFYEPYRDYPAPVLAAAGNHDGMVAPQTAVASLDAFLRNFCSDTFVVNPEAGGLSRTAQIQPGVFFTLDSPYVRILVLYSNALEDPGVISDADIGRSQLDFLEAALKRVKAENYKGALLLAHHHPPFAHGGKHGWSVQMQQQIDQICDKVGVWPHADLAGHAHSYQRFTRTRKDGTEIPYVVCGNGGHNVQMLKMINGVPIRVPVIVQTASANADQVVFENYDGTNYGYLRIIVTTTQLRIEYHPASDGTQVKTPDDAVTVDLASHKLVHFAASIVQPQQSGAPPSAVRAAGGARRRPAAPAPRRKKKKAGH